MKKYLIIAVAVIIAGAYLFGLHMGRMKCEMNSVRANIGEMVSVSDIKRDTDEKVFNTGVGDIRRILHTKYTIAE